MKIVIPAYTPDLSGPVDLVLDQIRVAVESFYHHGNYWGEFVILTNNPRVRTGLLEYRASESSFFNRGKQIDAVLFDFDQEWGRLGLEMHPAKTRRNFIISKILPVMYMEEDFLLMDYDIMTTGYIDPSIIASDKIRLFAANRYEGATLMQLSRQRGLTPEVDLGNLRWVNSGIIYFPAGKARALLQEYWAVFNSVEKREYKGVSLYHITDDELLYNMLLIDRCPDVELVTKYNINCILSNLYGPLTGGEMFGHGTSHPKILNVHFVGNFIKPYDVVIDSSGELSYRIRVEKSTQGYNGIRWLFDMAQHVACDSHYNALLFSIVWQYYNCRIKESMGIDCLGKSSFYEDFYYNSLVPDRK